MSQKRAASGWFTPWTVKSDEERGIEERNLNIAKCHENVHLEAGLHHGP